MNEPSLEFNKTMDRAFGKAQWSFDSFTDGTIRFCQLSDLPGMLKSRLADYYTDLKSQDVLAYNDKPGLVTDKAKVYKPLTAERMARIKPAIYQVARA